MNSQDFLLLNVICGVFFVLWYWRSREAASKKPTQLNLYAQDTRPLVIPPPAPTASELSSHVATARSARFSPEGAAAKNLNILFNYNGHCWDAYEVLGVPAGAALPAVTEAYQKCLRTTDSASHEFLHTAYQTILQRHTSKL